MSARLQHTPAPGMPCPECGQRIVVEPQQLLIAGAVRCPACNLELRVDSAASAGSLQALARYLAALRTLQARIDDTAPPTARGRPRGTRRAPRRRPRRKGASDG